MQTPEPPVIAVVPNYNMASGLRVLIDTDIKVRTASRNLAMGKNELKIIKKFGLRSWLLPDGKFRPSL